MKKKVYYYEDNSIKIKQITARYGFALSFINDGLTVDIGCGARMGPYILSQGVSKVVAVDISEEAVIYSARKWPRKNTLYVVADAKKLPFREMSFENIVSLEVMEHIDEHRLYLSEINRVLKAGGIAVISTPNKKQSLLENDIINPDHIREFDKLEFVDLLRDFFSSFSLYGQRPSDIVIRAEGVLKDFYRAIEKIPRFLKENIGKKLKSKISKKLIYLYARFFILPDPNKISEADFVFEQENIEKARNFVAIIRK